MGNGKPTSTDLQAATSRKEFVYRVLIITALIAAVWVLWVAGQFVLIIFASVLLAIFLLRLTDWVKRWTHVSEPWALAIVLVALLAFWAGATWLVATPISGQVQQLREELPRAINDVQQRLQTSGWGKFLLERLQAVGAGGGQVAKHISDFFSVTIEGVVGLLLILFLGINLAAAPKLYMEGLANLFPPRSRPRLQILLQQLGTNLESWLWGQLVAMTIVGLLTWIGLSIMGVPLAGALGFIAGLLDFIPVVGPWVAGLLSALLAFMKYPMLAVWVAVLFVSLNFIEGHLIIPQVQKYATKLPPALTLLALGLFGKLFGFLGVLLATPLLVAVVTLVKRLYQQDVLENPPTKED